MLKCKKEKFDDVTLQYSIQGSIRRSWIPGLWSLSMWKSYLFLPFCIHHKRNVIFHNKLIWFTEKMKLLFYVDLNQVMIHWWVIFIFCQTCTSLCQRLGLTLSVRNKSRVWSAGIKRRRHESPPEAKDEWSESFAAGARGFAKKNRVFEHTHLPLCRPGVSIQRNHNQKMNLRPLIFIDHNVNP